MNINKKLKPNLVDPKYRLKINKTLNPPKQDYWKPTKNVLQMVYSDYVLPNIWIIIFIFVILLLLLCRYRMVQNQKLEEAFKLVQDTQVRTDETINYSDIAINAYNQQKEKSAEPRINTTKNTNRVNWAPTSQSNILETLPSGLAYPMFPYVKGGTLLPSTPKER